MPNPFLLAAERHFAPVSARDPVGWARDKGIYLWSKQREFIESIRDNRYTAVHACHDSGKSYGMAVAGSNHLETNSVGDAFLVSTAPSVAQVDAILWREIRKLRKSLGLRGRIIGGGYPQWLVGDELIGYGRKPADYDQDVFQGIHAPRVLIIIDEADGVPKDLFDAVDALATNEYARVACIGNPDNPESHFATVCQPGSGWNVIHIDGLQTPNFNANTLKRFPLVCEIMEREGLQPVDEVVPEPLRVGLLHPSWVEERVKRWGVDSPLWMSKVRGQFPNVTTKQVTIPLAWVEAAIQRWHDWRLRGCPEPGGAMVHGLDVAREGDDESALASRIGYVFLDNPETFSIADSTVLAELVHGRMGRVGCSVVVDVVGVGGPVYDMLNRMGDTAIAFSAGSRADTTDISGELTFDNCRSAAWWKLRESLDPSRSPVICLPDDDDLKAELTAPRYSVHGKEIRVEPKEKVKKRLKRSTDRADAVIQSWWISDGVMTTSLTGLASEWKQVSGSQPLVSAWASTHWETEGSSPLASWNPRTPNYA
jgi:hypothetical protein